MADRSAWLELTREAVLEPELPICDCHHHLWDYPDSRYLVDEFLHDINGEPVEIPPAGTVVSTCS
jgi:hypothetical protein